MDREKACSVHPEVLAAVACLVCEQRWCPACSTVRHPRGDFSVCPRCQGKGRLEKFVPVDGPLDYARSIGDAFRYPLAGKGWAVLVGGGLMSGFVGFALSLGGMMMPVPAIAVALFMFSYFWRYMLTVVDATAEGRDELPDWPDIRGGLDDTAVPLFRLLAALALCLWPAVLAWFLGPPPLLGFFAIVLAGLALLPMNILVLALGGRVTDLNPLITWPAIVRAGWPYGVAVLALLLTVAARSWAGVLVSGLWLSGIFGGIVSTYFLAVQMRIIGLLYRSRRSVLGLI